jgi:hypothetical protein
MAVVPGTSRWRELVAEGIRLNASNGWFFGDAALEICPIAGRGVSKNVLKNVKLFAKETGVRFSTMHEYRRVAAVYPPGERIEGLPWTVHQILSSADTKHLIAPGMTTTQALRARKLAHPVKRKSVDPQAVRRVEALDISSLAVARLKNLAREAAEVLADARSLQDGDPGRAEIAVAAEAALEALVPVLQEIVGTCA